ncbi:MAG: hypothetical protein NC548_50595 [Lachnospiraceae bacterium]|nr:hypothetical protein [Lachnospiraceae bacterium]
MISIEDITRELLKIEQQLSTCTHHIESSKNKILDVMNRAQGTFSDQQPGQYLVILLSEAMKGLVCADSSLYSFKLGIDDYIRQLKR